jgi:hypothetical protein
MYPMKYNIEIKTDGKKYRLALIHSIVVEKSVELLTDTATIILPEAVLNQVLNFESKIKRGSSIKIELGYSLPLKLEFVGYVEQITNVGSSLEIKCEDELFVFRKQIADKVFKTTTVKNIAGYLISQVNSGYKVICDYDLGYEKFVIHQATAYDVLKKLREELRCNIYFKSDTNELHIHAPYKDKGGSVKYSMHQNIESSSLEYKKAIDKKYEITVESIDKKGKVQSIKSGTTGGDSVTIKVGAMNSMDLKRIADAELSRRSFDGYEGSFDAWLIPYVEPTYSAQIIDNDYPDKKGTYYVTAVKTEFSDAGGKRTINLGIKLANG